MPGGGDTFSLTARLQQEQRLAEIAERYLRGETQPAIAAALGINQSNVSRALKKLLQRWQDKSLFDFEPARAKELASVNNLERVCWEAWLRSLEPKETTATEKSTRGEAAGGSKASIRKETRDGNPAFLDRIAWCIQRRCALLGLDAPTRQEITGAGGMPLVTSVVVEVPAGASLDEEASDGAVESQ